MSILNLVIISGKGVFTEVPLVPQKGHLNVFNKSLYSLQNITVLYKSNGGVHYEINYIFLIYARKKTYFDNFSLIKLCQKCRVS